LRDAENRRSVWKICTNPKQIARVNPAGVRNRNAIHRRFWPQVIGREPLLVHELSVRETRLNVITARQRFIFSHMRGTRERQPNCNPSQQSADFPIAPPLSKRTGDASNGAQATKDGYL
jgi:hypothetical protein